MVVLGGGIDEVERDHSMEQILDRMIKRGELNAEQVDCSTPACSLQAGEFLLIASDGIKTISDDEIAQHLADSSGDAETAAALLSTVVARSAPQQDFLLISSKTERETGN